MLSEKTWPHDSGNYTRDTEIILSAVGISRDEYQFGKTKLFIKKPESLFDLEQAREKRMHHVVSVMQNAYRKWKARLYFQKVRYESVQLLHGKKRRNNSWMLYFLGDYENIATNELVKETINEHNDGKVIFSIFLDRSNLKMVKKQRVVTRQMFVMTPSSMLFFDENATKLIERIPFNEIQDVNQSTYADGFIIINLTPVMGKKGPEKRTSVVIQTGRKAELITVLVQEYKKNMITDLPLNFKDTIDVVGMQKPKGFFKKPVPTPHTVTFVENSNLPKRTAELVNQILDKKDP